MKDTGMLKLVVSEMTRGSAMQVQSVSTMSCEPSDFHTEVQSLPWKALHIIGPWFISDPARRLGISSDFR